MMSLSGVGFDIGQPADRELVDLMERAIATLPEEEKRYRVRIRSMLTSVLVATTDSSRREELAAEALAIAEADGDAELIASAQLARRLALWRRDALEERTAAVLVAVTEARRSGNIHLELTASMFAMSDLLELGRADEHRALLAEFRARAAALHIPTYEVYAHFIEASHRLAAGEYDEARRLADLALETGRSAHGVNAEIVYAGIMFRMAQDLDQRAELIDESARMMAANPRMRLWQIAHLGALVDAGRLDEVRPILEDIIGEDGVRLPDNQMFLISTCALVAAAAALGDRERALVLRRALEPYAERFAVSGLGGISIGPVQPLRRHRREGDRRHRRRRAVPPPRRQRGRAAGQPGPRSPERGRIWRTPCQPVAVPATRRQRRSRPPRRGGSPGRSDSCCAGGDDEAHGRVRITSPSPDDALRRSGQVVEEVGGRHEEQAAGDGGREVEDPVVVARRIADEHVPEHLLDHARRRRVADEVGAELVGDRSSRTPCCRAGSGARSRRVRRSCSARRGSCSASRRRAARRSTASDDRSPAPAPRR